MNLYKVTCKGMLGGGFNIPKNGTAYVVANDPTTAYSLLFETLCKHKLGTSADRVLDKIELIASIGLYPTCGTQLLISGDEE